MAIQLLYVMDGKKLQHLMVMIYLASGRKSEEGIPMKHPDIQGEFKVKPMSV